MTTYQAYDKAKKAQKRFPELEPDIIQDVNIAYLYAKNVIKGRWYEAEPTIMQSPLYTCIYARDVIKGRWPEGEPIIARNMLEACVYAIQVMQNRWIEIEHMIAQSEHSQKYIEHFFDGPLVTKDELGAFVWDRMQLPGYFAPASMFETKVSVLDMMVIE